MSRNPKSKLRAAHSIVALELESLTPTSRQKRETVYISSTSMEPEEFLAAMQKKFPDSSLPGKPIRTRQELVNNYRPSKSKSAVERRRKETSERLHKLGYEVYPQWRVYVLDIDPDNPKPIPAKDRGERNHVVYVGQTSNDITTRLKQHQGQPGKDGRYLVARDTKGRSLRINWDLTPDERVFSKQDAEKFERDYSLKLEHDGYGVLGDGLTDPAKKRIRPRDS